MGLTITMFSSFAVIKRFMRTQESWPLLPRTLYLKNRQKAPLVSHALEGPPKGSWRSQHSFAMWLVVCLRFPCAARFLQGCPGSSGPFALSRDCLLGTCAGLAGPTVHEARLDE